MKPLIKPSHKGLLHKDLGVPQGQKIPESKLESAKANGSPAVRKRANFALNFNENGHHGHVSSIDLMHDDPTMARVGVKHTKPGKKKRKGEINYDYEHNSTVVMPAKHAKRLKIGQRVGVGLAGLPDGEPADGPDTEPDDDESTDPGAAEDAYRSTMRGILFNKSSKRGK